MKRSLARQPDFSIVGEAAPREDPVGQVARLHPDVVVLDVEAAGSGPELCRRIRLKAPQTQVVILTSSEDAALLAGSTASGAAAYVLKEVNPQRLASRIRAAHERRPANERPRMAERRPPPDVEEFLSPTDRAVIRHVADGLTNQAIAERLGLSPNTIKDRLAKICRLFRVRSRAHLAARAIQERVI